MLVYIAVSVLDDAIITKASGRCALVHFNNSSEAFAGAKKKRSAKLPMFSVLCSVRLLNCILLAAVDCCTIPLQLVIPGLSHKRYWFSLWYGCCDTLIGSLLLHLRQHALPTVFSLCACSLSCLKPKRSSNEITKHGRQK